MAIKWVQNGVQKRVHLASLAIESTKYQFVTQNDPNSLADTFNRPQDRINLNVYLQICLDLSMRNLLWLSSQPKSERSTLRKFGWDKNQNAGTPYSDY